MLPAARKAAMASYRVVSCPNLERCRPSRRWGAMPTDGQPRALNTAAVRLFGGTVTGKGRTLVEVPG